MNRDLRDAPSSAVPVDTDRAASKIDEINLELERHIKCLRDISYKVSHVMDMLVGSIPEKAPEKLSTVSSTTMEYLEELSNVIVNLDRLVNRAY